MKVRFYGKEGQIYCYDCGALFELDTYPTGAKEKRVVATQCPNCNRGSWVAFERDEEFSVPVELDVTKVRRRIEDRLRKDPFYFKKVLRLG